LIFTIILSNRARVVYEALGSDPSQKGRFKAVKKTLWFLSQNPRHRSLETHELVGMQGPNGEKVFEAYAQNETPAAWRVFWYYGPGKAEITIALIARHP